VGKLTRKSARITTAGELESTRKTQIAIAKRSQTLPVIIGSLFGGTEIAPPQDAAEYIALYQSVVWVYSCVFAIASTGSGIPIHLYRRVKTGKEELMDHDLLTLLDRPNPNMSWRDLIEVSLIYLELCGEVYWEIVYNRLRIPAEIWPLRPSRMSINTSKDRKRITSYTFKIGTYKCKFLPRSIIHFRYFNPNNDWHGQSSIQAATETILTEQYAASYNKDFFQHGGTPTGVLETDFPLSRGELKRLRSDWRRWFTGPSGSHQTPILPRGMKYSPVALSTKDMELLLLRRLNREEILSVFGVPPVKVGLLDYAKFANYELQETAFHRDTMVPKLLMIRDVLNRELIPKFRDNSLIFGYELDAFLQGDPVKMSRMHNADIQHGVLTPNEVRKFKGLKPYKDGDQFYISKQLTTIPMSPVVAASGTGLPPNVRNEETAGKNGNTDEDTANKNLAKRTENNVRVLTRRRKRNKRTKADAH